MAITRNLVVMLKDDVAKPKEKMFVYRDDVGVEMVIELKDFDYSIDTIGNRNNIQKAYALFRTPTKKTYQYTNIKISNGKLVFTFSQDIVNVMQEIGEYELQFQLYDKEDNRLTIPSYNFYVKEPLTIDGELVDTAVVDKSIIVDLGEEQDYIFVITDGYIKTKWRTGDLITKERLNKVENALAVITDAVNSKVGISQLHNHENKEILDTISANKINEWDSKSNFDGDYNNLTNKPTIPTKVSDLLNDSGYLTEHQDISGKVDKVDGKSLISDDEIERLSTLKNYDDTNIYSQLNDIGSELSTKADKTELHSHSNKTVLDGISSAKVTEWDNKSTFSGNYNDLTNKPTIPSLNGYATEQYVNEEIEKIDVTEQLTDYAKKSDLEVKADKSYVDSAIESVDVSSQLTNYATKSELLSKVDKVAGKSLISDSEIERLSTLNNYDDTDIKNTLNSKANKTDLHSHTNKTVLDGITSAKVNEWNNKSTFDGNYNNLTNKPNIPTKTSQLTNDSGFITTVPSEYINETELQVHTDQVLSAGEQLVLNGSQILQNNYNFSQLTYDGAVANNSGGSLLGGVGKRQDIISDYFFTINPNKPIYASFDVKGEVGSRMYAFVDFYDVDKQRISASTVMYQPNTLTRLTQDLKNGDTVVHLEDLANWEETLTATHQRSFIFWNYTNKQGYTYPPETYSRNTFQNVYTGSSSVDKVNKTITLTTAWNKGTIPAGTYVSQGNNGNNYRYIKGASLAVTTEWKTISSVYEGIDYTGSNIQSKLPPGTAFAKFGAFINYNGVADEKVWITNIVVKEDIYSDLTSHKDNTNIHVTNSEKTTWNNKSNLTLGTSSTTAFRGDYGNTAYTHSQATHAPSNAQKNSDITKAEIEAKLVGNITTHNHDTYALDSVVIKAVDYTGGISDVEINDLVARVTAIEKKLSSGTTFGEDGNEVLY